MMRDILRKLVGGGTRLKHRIEKIRREHIICARLKDFKKDDVLIPIETHVDSLDAVSEYWTGHTVHDDWFTSAEESLKYREWVFSVYPYYREFADMDRKHDGETILDYGCGPGNDLTWYTQKANPDRIIGIDVSRTALENAQFRMALHGVKKDRCRLILIDEATPIIPLDDESVDFVSCQGVLMHTSFPEKILKEFCRVLKAGSCDSQNNACIMVYNRESIWYHLYAAYYLRYVNPSPLQKDSLDDVQKMELADIFRQSTDGVGCPQARCWEPEIFKRMCMDAGFKEVKYMGGYPNNLEPGMAKDYLIEALKDDRLDEEHKAFLRKVQLDKNGYPIDDEGRSCCVGGVYRLWK